MSTQASRNEAKVAIERTYRANVKDVWALSTTKEGFESWWGPQGFRAAVQELDARVGGAPSVRDDRRLAGNDRGDDFISAGDSVRMVVMLDAIHSDEFTKMQKERFTSQR